MEKSDKTDEPAEEQINELLGKWKDKKYLQTVLVAFMATLFTFMADDEKQKVEVLSIVYHYFPPQYLHLDGFL